MAPRRFCPCYFSCQNLSLESVSLFLGSALSYNPTPGPVPVPPLALAPVPIDKLFKQFIKAYLKMNQMPNQPLVEYE